MSNAMKRAKTYIVGAPLAASVFLFGVMSAFADSYSVNVVAYTQSENFYGIDGAGDFVVNVVQIRAGLGEQLVWRGLSGPRSASRRTMWDRKPCVFDVGSEPCMGQRIVVRQRDAFRRLQQGT